MFRIAWKKYLFNLAHYLLSLNFIKNLTWIDNNYKENIKISTSSQKLLAILIEQNILLITALLWWYLKWEWLFLICTKHETINQEDHQNILKELHELEKKKKNREKKLWEKHVTCNLFYGKTIGKSIRYVNTKFICSVSKINQWDLFFKMLKIICNVFEKKTFSISQRRSHRW